MAFDIEQVLAERTAARAEKVKAVNDFTGQIEAAQREMMDRINAIKARRAAAMEDALREDGAVKALEDIKRQQNPGTPK